MKFLQYFSMQNLRQTFFCTGKVVSSYIHFFLSYPIKICLKYVWTISQACLQEMQNYEPKAKGLRRMIERTQQCGGRREVKTAVTISRDRARTLSSRRSNHTFCCQPCSELFSYSRQRLIIMNKSILLFVFKVLFFSTPGGTPSLYLPCLFLQPLYSFLCPL